GYKGEGRVTEDAFAVRAGKQPMSHNMYFGNETREGRGCRVKLVLRSVRIRQGRRVVLDVGRLVVLYRFEVGDGRIPDVGDEDVPEVGRRPLQVVVPDADRSCPNVGYVVLRCRIFDCGTDADAVIAEDD